jgi:L-arabinokinase
MANPNFPSQPPSRPPAQSDDPAVAIIPPTQLLVRRLREELAADFDSAAAIRLSRAPGRLDVMGGIADYTGSMVCEATLDRSAAVALQTRSDRQVQVFSFNLFDEHQPFTFRMPLEALAEHSAEELRAGFNEPGRKWAGYMAGCLFVMHERGLVDLTHPSIRGMNLAVYSTVPLGAGVSSSAAVEVATRMNLLDHFGVRGRVDAMEVAAMCQAVENRLVGAPCGIMDQATSCAGQVGTLLRMVCQPHELLPPLALPQNVRVLGINSNVKHSVGGGMYGKTRCAAFMAHRIILDQMRKLGEAAGRTLVGDPMGGYLANLDPDDYKRYFRPILPEILSGEQFLADYGPTIDTATSVDPKVSYSVQHAADHHVMEARRVRDFVGFLEEAANRPPATREQGIWLDKAGHLMYASHHSYTHHAMLGAPECDLIVELVRKREAAGLYGAKITGGGSGGTVAVLADKTDRADRAIADIVNEYERRAGRRAEALAGSSDGAWMAGTQLL